MAKMSSINKNNRRIKLSNKFYKKRKRWHWWYRKIIERL